MLIGMVSHTKDLADLVTDEAGRRESIKEALRKAGAVIQRHHKTKEFVSGRGKGTNLMTQPPHPTKLTHRTRTLSKSYTIIFPNEYTMSYGSDVKYSAVHEFGCLKKNIPVRATLYRTIYRTQEEIDEIMADHVEKSLDK
jgi:phage gpG-like protein